MTSFPLLGSVFTRSTGLLTLTAFLISRASILPGTAVPCLAFFAAILTIDRPRAPVVGLGCFLGLLSVGPFFYALRYTFLGLLIYLLAIYLPVKNSLFKSPPVLGLVVAIIGRGVLLLWQGQALSQLAIGLLEGTLVLALAMIFVHGLPVLARQGTLRGLNNEESICLVIIGTIVMLGFSGLNVWFLSLRQVFGKYLLLLFALVGGAGLGAALGTVFGAVGLAMGSLPATAPGAYAFTGLLAGSFRRLGKIGSGISFLVGDLLLTLFVLQSAHPGVVLGEGLAALILLLVTPTDYLAKVARLLPGTQENRRLQEEYDSRVRQLAVGRLTEVSQVFAELSATIDEIAVTEHTREEERLNNLFREICQRVCEDCNLYQSCWEEQFYQTYCLLFELLDLASHEGSLSRNQIPREFRRRCVRLSELITTINHIYDLSRLNHHWQERLQDKGGMVSEQLRGVACIVNDLVGELQVDLDYREGLSNKLYQQLLAAQIELHHINAFCNPQGHVEINIGKAGCPATAECSRVVLPIAEKVCGRHLKLEQSQCALRTGGQCVLRLTPARAFTVETGVATRPKNGVGVSGDNYSVLELSNGWVALILSDGMGVGSRAAQESAITITLLERLLNAGFKAELSLRTVNNMLMLRTGEDNYATVDLVLIDVFAGEAQFVKVGSYSSFIKRGRQVAMIETPSLPIGIVEEIQVKPDKRRVRAGDFIILVTDGVVGDKIREEDRAALIDYIQGLSIDDAGPLAGKILAWAHKRAGQPRDDMAVLVARIGREV